MVGARKEGSEKYKEYVAGLATVFTGHPFDTVKVKLQKQHAEVHSINYSNGLHCAARIVQIEGVRGFYRGASSSFIGIGFESSLLFGIYTQTKEMLQGNLQSSGPNLLVIIPSAACSGAIISVILCPTELVKDASVRNTFLSSKVKQIFWFIRVRSKNIQKRRGLFRGGVTTFLRECVGNAAFFTVYESFKHVMHLKLEILLKNIQACRNWDS